MATADTTRWRALATACATAVALLLAGCGEPAPKRDASGTIEQSGKTRLLDLRVGDCIADLRKSIDDPDGGNNGDLQITAVPCAEPHDGEVLRISSVGADIANGPWPGSHAVDGEAARGRQALQARLTAPAAGKITLVSFRPTQERWEFEHQRTIVFIALFAKQRRGTLD
jgi:hypothetical protein